jgi:hypothetical protein
VQKALDRSSKVIDTSPITKDRRIVMVTDLLKSTGSQKVVGSNSISSPTKETTLSFPRPQRQHGCEILNPKHQILNYIKARNTNDQEQFRDWNFDIWICLEPGNWDLEFGRKDCHVPTSRARQDRLSLRRGILEENSSWFYHLYSGSIRP